MAAWVKRLAWVVALGASSAIARAADPFSVNAQTTSGSPQAVTASGSSLPDLVSNLIKSESQFAPLADRNISAGLRYGNVNNAIVITRNSTGTSATVAIPSINFQKTFTAGNSHDLNKQVEDFARKNGASTYGRFIRSIDQQSDLGLIDGNPLAATSLLAGQAYHQFGLMPEPFQPGQRWPNPLDQVAVPRLSFDLGGGATHSATGNGYFGRGEFSFGLRFSDRVGLALATPFLYREIGGANSFEAGEEVSLPILLLPPNGDRTFSWLLTPTASGGAAGSLDMASGGTFVGGSITSSLSYQFSGFVFTLANHFSYFHGLAVGGGQYKLDTDLEQELFKNGVKVTRFFGNSLFIDAGVTYTNSLQKAAVREYWSPEAGVGYRFSENAGLRVGYAGDFGPGFVVNGGSVQFYFNY